MTKEKTKKLLAWAIGWLEKMSIVTIFNGLFVGSATSLLVGIMCAAASLFFTMRGEE
ncbi:hypothetical protein QUW15_01235 [Desulfovibrio piger]|nr:hypothetical protein [Desulfovibrio piger]